MVVTPRTKGIRIRTNGEQEGKKGEERTTKTKNRGTSFANFYAWLELMDTERMSWAPNKQPENHLLRAAAERWSIFSTTFMLLPLSQLLSEQPLPPQVLLQL